MKTHDVDIVLVNPGNRAQIYQALGSELSAIESPVWVGLIATFLRTKGCSVAVIDANAESLTPEQTAQRIAQLRPHLTAVVVYGHQPSASTQNMPAAGAICTAVKRQLPEQKAILVGGHVASLPERTLQEEDADFVSGGEGLYTLWELIQVLQSNRPDDYRSVRDLWYRENGTVQCNPPAPLLKDLDGEMPGMAWDLLPMDKYRAHNWHALGHLKRQPYAAMYTTLGCPYHCSFCLRKGTMIITAKGRNKKIEDLNVGDKVMGWDEKAKQLAETSIVALGSRWVNRLLRVRMQTGETIEITHEHPVFTDQGWVEAGDLKVGQTILVMDKKDKVAYLRKHHNPSKRMEVRAKISEMKKLDNPARRPEVRAKISATILQQRDILSERMKRLHAEGRIPHRPMSEQTKQQHAERMKRLNPMRDAAVAKRMGVTRRRKISAGDIEPYMRTAEGKRVIADLARQRALTDNPMKDPSIALAEPLRRRRSEIMHELWQDEDRSDRLVQSREGKYVTGERHWMWRGGISKKPYPPQFTAYLRRKIRKRDGYTCQHCGSTDTETLSVHHIDYERENCDPCNLITLCISCNSKANANREKWKAYYTEKMMAIGNCPHFVSIESIEELPGDFQVFNFECAPHDNYFAEFLLVHNCCIQAPFKSGEKELGYKESVNSYRFWSADTILAQLDDLVRTHGVRNVKFADELFVINPRHVRGICEGIIARGYDLNIWAYARVDTVRDDMIELLKRAGVNWLAFGIEAANAKVRDQVQKGFDQNDIAKTIDRVRQAGIRVIGNYIFGLPEDDLATMQETLDLALELNCEFANFYATQAYPGSALYSQAVQEGWPLPEQWSGYSQHSVDTRPLSTKHISSGEVLQFRDHAFQVYFNSPRYLEMIERTFGPETVAHIKEMASHKLVRQQVPVATP